MDARLIGHTWPAFEVVVERGTAVAFARGLDETNPIYLDEVAAREAGLRGQPTLPTYPIAMSTERVDLIYDLLRILAVDPAKILHANQRFVYHQPLYVGDRLRGTKRISDLYDRKNGALFFIETVVDYRDPKGDPVCEDHCTLVARNS